jgi:hypothetical protein
MTPVFAHTFYFLALANRKDQAHSKCLAFSQLKERLHGMQEAIGSRPAGHEPTTYELKVRCSID